jgi:hypothetical protein
MLILAELTPLDTSTGNRITLRAASSDDRKITNLNGVRWWPAIKETPVLTIKLFDGDFSSETDVGTAALTLLTDKLARLDANARRYLWAGAGVTIYAGNSGDAWPWTTWFTGTVDSFKADANRLQITAKVNIEPFQKPALTLTYAGTGGIEGGADLKGKPKPWLFGHALNVEPVLIDSINSVFQFSAYGPIQAINNLYERASDFGASVGDFATYTTLVAATIPAGRWGTCLASGLIRLGAPQYGVITGDVDGDKPSTWLRKTGEIINRIATNAGVSGTLIDSASLTALDTALPYNINLYLTDQTTVLDLVRRLARPCNAQAAISWLGKLFVTRVAIGSPALTLDAQGRRKPGVIASSESDVSPPYWRLQMGAQRAWRVHTFDEIASADKLTLRGAYSASAWYKPGDIVTDQGTSWQYNGAATPGTGNAPPTLPTVSNTQWTAMSDPGSSVVVTPTASDFRTTDNIYNPSSQTITFTAALYNLTGTVSWTAKNPAGTTVKSGTGTSFSLAQSDMGTNLSLVVAATCGWASSQPVTIGVVDDSTAEASATKNSPDRALNRNSAFQDGLLGYTNPYAGTPAFSSSANSARGNNVAVLDSGEGVRGEQLSCTPGETLWFTYRFLTTQNNTGGAAPVWYVGLEFGPTMGGSPDADGGPVSNVAYSVAAGAQSGATGIVVPAGKFAVNTRGVCDLGNLGGGAIGQIDFMEIHRDQPGADITAFITGTSDITISCDSSGTPTSDALAQAWQFKLYENGVQVTTGITWSCSTPTGLTSPSITGSGTGTLTIGGMTTDTVPIVLTAARTGYPSKQFTVTFTKSVAPAPVSGGSGGGTGGSAASQTSGFTSISSATAAVISQSGDLSVTVGSTGQVTYTCALTDKASRLGPPAGTWVIRHQWERWNGSSWVSQGSTFDATTAVDTDGTTLISTGGSASNSQNVTSLTVGSTCKMRLTAWIVSGSSTNTTKTINFTGQISLQG